jgi:NADH dehydrogenase
MWSTAPASLRRVPRACRSIAGDPDLSVVDRPGTWALGDCAEIPKPEGGTYPQIAQHAVHEALRLARNLVASVRGRPTQPYAYRTLGMMASLGAHEGLAEIGGRLAISGLAGWTLDLRFPQDIASVR